MRGRKVVPEGIRITKVGLWYVLLTVVVAVAATNTGNNALYMVLALMLAALLVSGFASRHNVRALELEIEPPPEIFANRPFRVRFRLHNRGRLLPRWFLLFGLERRGQPLFIPYLPPHGTSEGMIELILPRRGPHHFGHGHLSSLFPFGLFRKGTRHRVDLEALVFPEIFAASRRRPEAAGDRGPGPSRRAPWGHELHSLRGFRKGDDPRGIHWKQSARTGDLIYIEREQEGGQRLSILLDNGVGPLHASGDRERFEALVSEAATAALDHLARGFEVELVTRDGIEAFGSGRRQRLAILETLARLEPGPRKRSALVAGDPRAARLRLGFEGAAAA